jgi:serine/threonine protein kinase
VSRCLSADQFQALLAEQLSAAERGALDAHVDVCSDCQATLTRLLDEGEGESRLDWHRLWRGSGQTPLPPVDDWVRRLKAKPPLSTPTDAATPNEAAALLFPDPPTALGPLGRLASYHVVSERGRGAFGIVYQAYDEELDCPVALKVLKPELAASVTDRARFEGEARKAAGIRHDHVVAIHRVGNTPGFALPYFVMEYVDGEALSERLRRGALAAREAAQITLQAALGLSAAHARGLVHRDINPANILLEKGSDRVKITDFGLARTVEVTSEKLTRSGGIVGTPPYMSPEQIVSPQYVDHRTDVYGLGVVLYELLTGELPFQGRSHWVLQQVVHDEPPPPRKLNQAIPRDLETITLKCLSKEPSQRYQTALDLAGDLRRFLAGEPVQARPANTWLRVVKWAQRRPATAALVAVSVVAFLSLLAGTLWHNFTLGAALRTADSNLYDSLVGEGRALRKARENGYRPKVFDLLKQARRLETPKKNLLELRSEAAACLGDYVGLEPTTWEEFPAPILSAALHPDGTQLAVGLGDGTVQLRRLPAGTLVARLAADNLPVMNLAFRADGKELVSTDSRIRLWQINGEGRWTCSRTFDVDRTFALMTPSLAFPFFTTTSLVDQP